MPQDLAHRCFWQLGGKDVEAADPNHVFLAVHYLRGSSTAPLDTPVVPLMYCSTAMSSAPIPGFFERAAAALG